MAHNIEEGLHIVAEEGLGIVAEEGLGIVAEEGLDLVAEEGLELVAEEGLDLVAEEVGISLAEMINKQGWRELGYVLCINCWEIGEERRFLKRFVLVKHNAIAHKGLKAKYNCSRCGNNLYAPQFLESHNCSVPLGYISKPKASRKMVQNQ